MRPHELASHVRTRRLDSSGSRCCAGQDRGRRLRRGRAGGERRRDDGSGELGVEKYCVAGKQAGPAEVLAQRVRDGRFETRSVGLHWVEGRRTLECRVSRVQPLSPEVVLAECRLRRGQRR